jgi:porin
MKTTALKNSWRALQAVLVLTTFHWPGSASEPAAAEESDFMRFLTRDYLLGDWGGARTDLSERGVDFEFFYAGSLPSNVDGGLERGSAYQGALLMTLDLDSQKLLGYSGGRVHVGSIWLHGEKPFSERYIGDLNKVNLVDFQNGAWLWELYYEQQFLEDKFLVKFGQLAIDSDFVSPSYYNSVAGLTLLNQTFFFPTMAFNVWDQPFYPVGHHALASTPYGTPGVLLRYNPGPMTYAQFGVYDGKPDTSPPGTRINLNEDEGALMYLETGLKLNQSPDAEGPPGNLKLGAYYHTDDFYDMYQGTFAAFDNYLVASGLPPLGVYPEPRTRDGNYGVYFLADQTLWREVGKEDPAQQGLVGFFRVAYAPEDRNLATWGVDGGLVYKGLIPKRDWDTLALAVSYLRISDELSNGQEDINGLLAGFGFPAAFAKTADYELVIEASYKAQLTAWWTLQTSVQRVIHPGGRVLADTPDALAVIAQTTVRF